MHRGGSTCAPQSCGLVAPCSKVSKLPRPRRAPREDRARESSRFNRVTKIYLVAGPLLPLVSKRIELDLTLSIPVDSLFDSSFYLRANNQLARMKRDAIARTFLPRFAKIEMRFIFKELAYRPLLYPRYSLRGPIYRRSRSVTFTRVGHVRVLRTGQLIR